MASEFQLRQAASILSDGGIISYQTDTLYGLSCDPYNQQATERLNTIKQRSTNKNFILLANTSEQLSAFVHLPENNIQTILPSAKPCSWIVNAKKDAPDWLKAADNTIAIRLSNDPITKTLCHILKQPLISSSANLSGQSVITNSLQCHLIFGNSVDMTLNSKHAFTGKPSRLLRLCDNKVIRP